VESGESEELEESLDLFLPLFSGRPRVITHGELLDGTMALRGRSRGRLAVGELVEGEKALGGRPRGRFAGDAEVVGEMALGGRPRGRFAGCVSVEASFGFVGGPLRCLDAGVATAGSQVGSPNACDAGGVTPDGTSES
jgi:hypothetical protein